MTSTNTLANWHWKTDLDAYEITVRKAIVSQSTGVLFTFGDALMNHYYVMFIRAKYTKFINLYFEYAAFDIAEQKQDVYLLGSRLNILEDEINPNNEVLREDSKLRSFLKGPELFELQLIVIGDSGLNIKYTRKFNQLISTSYPSLMYVEHTDTLYF